MAAAVCWLICFGFLELAMVRGITMTPACSPWEEANNLEAPSVATCAKPVEMLMDGQTNSGVSAKRPSQFPPWFNSTTFKEGQKFAAKHLFSMFFGPILVAAQFVSFPDTRAVLMSTNGSDTATRSNRRYLATMLHVKLWIEILTADSDDTAEGDGNGSISPFVRDSMFNVRAIHHQVINKLKDNVPYDAEPSVHKPDAEFWKAVRKDLKKSAIPKKFRDYPPKMKLEQNRKNAKPLNHLAMSVTQWMLAAPQVLFPEKCGIYGASDEEFEAFNHFWGVIGYAMGMEDEYNIPLQSGGLSATKAYYQEMYETYFLPSMFQIGHDGKILWEAFFNGFVEALFGSNGPNWFKKEQLMLLTLEEAMGVEATNLRATLSFADKALNRTLKQLLQALKYDTVRETLNNMLRKYYFESNSQDVFGFDGKNAEDIVESVYA